MVRSRRHHNNHARLRIKYERHLKPLKKLKEVIGLGTRTPALSNRFCWRRGRIIARIIDGRAYKRKVTDIADLEKIAEYFHDNGVFDATVLDNEAFDKLTEGSVKVIESIIGTVDGAITDSLDRSNNQRVVLLKITETLFKALGFVGAQLAKMHNDTDASMVFYYGGYTDGLGKPRIHRWRMTIENEDWNDGECDCGGSVEAVDHNGVVIEICQECGKQGAVR